MTLPAALEPAPETEPLGKGALLVMGALAAFMLVPVTLPVPVLRELVYDRFGVSELWTSLFMSINMVAAFLAAPLAGALSDRLGRRKAVILGALVIDAALCHVMTWDLPFPVFMGLRFLEGATNILSLSLLMALAADRADPLRRGRVMGLLGAGITLGVAMGAPIGGVMGKHFGALATLNLAGAISLVTALLGVFVLRDGPRVRTQRPGLRTILRTVFENKALVAPLAFAFTDRFTTGFFTTTFVLFLKRTHGMPPERVGLLIAMFMLPFSLLSFLFGRLADRISHVGLMASGSLLYGLAAMTVGFLAPEHLMWVMLVLGITAAVMFVPSLILTTDLTDPLTKATALGGFNAAGSLGFVCGPIVGALVSQTIALDLGYGWLWGYRAAFVTAGAAELLCVAIALPFLVRLVRQQRTT
ncbi:MAG: MFS transporter [Planctomycetota bacterium]|jgi:MFS family permease